MKNKILQYAPLESKRFDMKIFRYGNEPLSLSDLKEELAEQKADMAIFRIPAENQEVCRLLEAPGFPLLLADTLINFRVNLPKTPAQAIRSPELQFVLAVPEDQAIVQWLIAASFDQFTNHYTANPFLDASRMVEGYQEWVVSFLREENGRVWLIKDDGRFVGFGSFVVDPDTGTVKGILGGIHPSARGKQIYSDMHRFIVNQYRSEGFQFIDIPTQAQNTGSIRGLEKEGYRAQGAFHTFHLNSLLTHSLIPPLFLEKEEEIHLPLLSDYLSSVFETRTFSILQRRDIELERYSGISSIRLSFPGKTGAGRQNLLLAQFLSSSGTIARLSYFYLWENA